MFTPLIAHALLTACSQPPQAEPPRAHADSAHADSGTTAAPHTQTADTNHIDVLVTLDGAPVEGALVIQGGTTEHWYTGADGRVSVLLDTAVVGDLMLVASHPEARVWGEFTPDPEEPQDCLLYTSPSPRDLSTSRMPSSA